MGMNGYLQKSGKRTRMRVTRFFELEGTVLSSHRAEKMDATWTIDISDSILTGSNPQLEINIEIPDMKSITLYADSSESFAKWMQALENAVARVSIPYSLSFPPLPAKKHTYIQTQDRSNQSLLLRSDLYPLQLLLCPISPVTVWTHCLSSAASTPSLRFTRTFIAFFSPLFNLLCW